MKFTIAVVSLLTIYGYVAAGPIIEAEKPEARATNAYIFADCAVDFSNVFGYFKTCTDKLNKAQLNEYWTTSTSTKLQIQRYLLLIGQFRFQVNNINNIYATNTQIFAADNLRMSINAIINILKEVRKTSNENKLSNASAIASRINICISNMESFKVKVQEYNSIMLYLFNSMSASEVNAFISTLYSAAQAISDSSVAYTEAMETETFGFFAFAFDFVQAVTSVGKDAAKNSLRTFYAGLESTSTSAQTLMVETYFSACVAVEGAVNVYVSTVTKTANASLTAILNNAILSIRSSTVDVVLRPTVRAIRDSFTVVSNLVKTELAAILVDMEYESEGIKADLVVAGNECRTLSNQIIQRLGETPKAAVCAAWYLPEIIVELRSNQIAIGKCQLKAQNELKADTDKIKALIQAAYLKVSANLTSCVNTCGVESGEETTTTCSESTTIPTETTVSDTTVYETTAVAETSGSEMSDVETTIAPEETTTVSAAASEEELKLQACIDAKVDVDFSTLRAQIKAITKELRKGGKRRVAIANCRASAKSSRKTKLASIKAQFISCSGVAAF